MIDERDFFKEVTLRISSSLEVEESFNSLFEYLKEFFPIDMLNLHFREIDGSVYSLAHAGDHTILKEINTDEPIMVMDDATRDKLQIKFSGEVERYGEVEIINSPVSDDFSKTIQKYSEFDIRNHSAMHLILGTGEDELGALSMIKYGENVFTPTNAELLDTIKEPLTMALINAIRYREVVKLKDKLAEDNRAAYQDLERLSGDQVIGADFGLRHVMDLVRQVSPLNSPVLLLGETGTGKEVIANAIHLSSSRREKPIIRVQCGAIPDQLLDSELFGHEKGSFTGAISTKRGRFERADGGTIFLDEIGELTLDAQVKLLRVLQEKEFERIGSSDTIKSDVRVIAATHRNLAQMVSDGLFREDLWFRLNVFPIHIPPLRHRKEDISSLTTHFILKKSREMGFANTPSLDPDSVSKLEMYNWPGNVRELQNVIERALIVNTSNILSFPHFGIQKKSTQNTIQSPIQDNFPTLDEVQKQHIAEAMKITNGKIQGKDGAAALLGINPSTLRARMRKFDIKFGRI